ncbi:MAG: histidinol dehydrogenase [Bacteroidetes bacterium]|nr:histidinol dehydrogenase [Bacteroidota bacterium]MDA1122085.1 histidinol dehydrogenase [Bacteroidota bacterium]
MRIVIEPSKDLWAELVKRPTQDFTKTERIVEPILDKVKRNGDKALKKFIREYDHVDIKDILISQEEILDSSKEVSEELKNAINSAKENIKKFHEAQVTKDIEMETIPGVFCSRKSVPIKKIGFYIPGGTAPLFSTVLMLGVPARIAGCEEIIICTPTNSEGKINPVILYTASLLGIEKIAKVGGAQAIAAMAYGTESIPRVDKIFGPGNQFVTVAKQIVSRDSVAIDMPAGPSEVLVVAGKKSNPAFVAADLLSQAEHGVDSQVVLVSKSKTFIKDVLNEIDKQVKRLSRRDVVLKALANSLAIQIKDKFVIADFINEYAPEHLIVALRKPGIILQHVCNAGSVFTGDYTPEAAGDYASGTNHTLPTNGWARSIGGVSLDSFIKKITYQRISPEGLQALGPVIEKMAEAELLEAHKNAVSIRLKYLKENGPS